MSGKQNGDFMQALAQALVPSPLVLEQVTLNASERRTIANEFISRWNKWADTPCRFAGGANGGHHSIDCLCEIDKVIR